VFPCVIGGKIPATPHGFEDKTTDPAQIDAWWSQADYNVGIVPCDMGLVAVDLDLAKRDGVSKALLNMLPAARTHRTPSGGEHRLYLSFEAFSNHGLGVNADVRSANGYILWPPSVVNGVAYEIADPREPEMLPRKSGRTSGESRTRPMSAKSRTMASTICCPARGNGARATRITRATIGLLPRRR
jgi:hypothetical protein